MFKKKKVIDTSKQSIELKFYDDGTLLIPKSAEKIIINTFKKSKLKEIELLNYSIINLMSQIAITKKMIDDNISNFENSKKNYAEKLRREINPDLLCSICFERRIDLVLTPCGHTFCSECFKDSVNCFQCRAIVVNKYKMFT